MGKTIMIVDDQLGIRLLLEEIVKSEGHQVMTAENGKAAVDKITTQKPDLLLIDYRLPIMDGVMVLNKLQEQNIHIPTIFMSGLADEAAEKIGGLEMVIKVLAKPFNVEDVRSIIKKHI